MQAAAQPVMAAQARAAATCCAADVPGLQEGVRGLYKGLLLSMVGIVPYLSISLSTYDTLKVRQQGGWWIGRGSP